jgi:hypothetical protein
MGRGAVRFPATVDPPVIHPTTSIPPTSRIVADSCFPSGAERLRHTDNGALRCRAELLQDLAIPAQDLLAFCFSFWVALRTRKRVNSNPPRRKRVLEVGRLWWAVGECGIPKLRHRGWVHHSSLEPGDSKYAYVDRSTNWVDWGVFGGQNVDSATRNRSWWTGWTVVLTFAKVRVAGSNPVFRSKVNRRSGALAMVWRLNGVLG